jgi:hypothetical protein
MDEKAMLASSYEVFKCICVDIGQLSWAAIKK